MLTNSVGSTQLGQCQHPPVRGGGRRGPGGSGRDRPGPLPALHRAEELGSQFLCPVQPRSDAIKILAASPATTSVPCEHPAALCSAAAGRPVIKGQQSGRARQLAFDAVPPRRACSGARESLSRSPRERRSDFRARGFRILGLIN